MSNPTNLTVYLGRNWNAGRNFNGKISDSVAEKTNKWMRVRHGTP